jgi:ribosomal protein L13
MTVQMVDTITVPSNVKFAIRWDSSDAASVSVDSTGLATGKAISKAVAICATASKDGYASKADCGTVVVTAP